MNLQNLLLVTSSNALESKTRDIKADLKEFKEKLAEMKDFCESTSSAKEILDSEYKIQKDHLSTVEARFRTTYLHAQQKLSQIERESLLQVTDSSSSSSVQMKKRNITNSQTLLTASNQMTHKLSDIHRQLKWTQNQTSDIIPVLDESSRLLKNTSQEFGTMRSAINDGKRLLLRLSRREFTDRLLIILCLAFFSLVCFYICWKRLF
jgi:phage-related tail protein